MSFSSSTELPRLLLIGDLFTRPSVASNIREAVRAGVEWVQLRDHDAGEEIFRESAVRLADELRAIREDVLISVNTRVAVRERIGGGLHVGLRGPAVPEARVIVGPDVLLGASVHSELAIDPDGADYLIWSPVYPTSTKPGHPGTGVLKFESMCLKAGVTPVIALGGIIPERVGPCLDAGAYGVAVLSGILGADDVGERVEEYLHSLSTEAGI